VQRFVHDAPYPLAFYAMSVEAATGTTYEEDEPVYRRWPARSGQATRPGEPSGAENP
jgi:hypothetical protein